MFRSEAKKHPHRKDEKQGLEKHGSTEDVNVPLGSGLAVLVSLGGTYLLRKKRKEEWSRTEQMNK